MFKKPNLALFIFIFLLISLFSFSLASAVLTDNLKAYWTLDEPSFQANDSLAVYNGTCTNVGYSTAGIINTCFNFPNNARCNVGTIDENENITISAWINSDNITYVVGGDVIVSNRNSGTLRDYHLAMNAVAGRISWGWSDYLKTSSTNLENNTWYFVVVTRSGVAGNWNATIYINGIQDGTANTATNPTATDANTRIGQDNVNAYYFDGRIDEVGLWERALTQEEITSLYNSGAGLSYPFSVGEDITPPTFTTIPANASLFYFNETLLVTFTGTDETGFGYYSQNDSRFTINQTGFLYNNTELGVGIYTINVTINDTSNNINWTIYKVTVKKDEYYACSVFFNATSPITYPDLFTGNANCNTDYTLYLNGTPIANASTINSGAGYYNVSVQRTDTQNYSNVYDENAFTVIQSNAGCNVVFNATTPQTYPYIYLAYSDCNSALTLKRNDTTIANNSVQISGAGTWNFSVQRTDSQNYSELYNDEYFTINPATTTLIISGSPAWTNVYPTETTVSVSGCPSGVTCVLKRNDTTVSPPDVQTFGVSAYNYTYNTAGNTNWTADSEEQILRITPSQEKCQVQFNATSPITYPDTFKAWANCTTAFTLKRNDTIVSNNSEQALAVSAYNFSMFRTDIINYSFNYNETQMRIVSAPDTTNPTPVLGTNPINFYNNSGSTSQFFEFKCFDDIAIANLSLFGNWTSWSAKYTNTSYTNNTDLNKTINGLANGEYVWGIRCFDTSSNEAWTTNRTFRINYTAPYVPPSNVTIGGGADCRYKKFGYYNLNLVWYREANCIE
jgi:hypothetical protein